MYIKTDLAHATQDEERVQMLADLLLCSQSCVLRMARKCPEVLTMAPNEVTQRLMLLKVRTSNSTASLTQQAESWPCTSLAGFTITVMARHASL